MILEPVTDTDVPFLIVRDLYNDTELGNIYLELEFLRRSGILDADDTKAAVDQKTQQKIKQAKGVFLDSLYSNRQASLILAANRKPFANDKIVDCFKKLSKYHYALYDQCDSDSTLINYYEDLDHYKAHSDSSRFSVVTWFFKEPKQFTGGNLKFVDLNRTIEIENNMCVIFPGYLNHEVEEVRLFGKTNHSNGRFSMAQFLTLTF